MQTFTAQFWVNEKTFASASHYDLEESYLGNKMFPQIAPL